MRRQGHLCPPCAAGSLCRRSSSRWRGGVLIQISNSGYVSAFSRHDLPEVLPNNCPFKKEGSRECRVRAAPAVSCAKLCEETHTSIQVQRRQSDIPRAMALRLMPRSPRRRIRLVTVAAGLMASSIRSDRRRHRQLGTSNGCRDHTVLPYATRLRQVASPGLVPFRRSLGETGNSAVRPARCCSLTETALRTSLPRPTLPRPPHPSL